MIKAECRRNLVNGRTAAAIVLIALILVFGNWDLLYSYLKHGGNVRVTDYGSVPLLRFSLAIDRVKLLIFLVLLLFGTGSLCVDIQNRFTCSVLTRTDGRRYLWAKVAANVVSLYVIVFAGFLLFCFLLLPIFPFTGKGDDELYEYLDVTGGRPVLYLAVAALLFSLSVALCSSLGILLSIIRPSKAIAYGVPMLVFYLLYGLTRLPPAINFYRIVSGYEVVSSNGWLNLAYCAGLLGGLILFILIQSVRILERCTDNAKI